MGMLADRMAKLGWVRVRAALTAAGLVVVAGLVSGDTSRASPGGVDQYPDRPMATLGSQFLPPSPLAQDGAGDESAADRPGLTDDEPAWRLDVPEGVEPTRVASTDAGYVVLSRLDQLVGFGQDGKQLWEYEHDPFDDEKVSHEVVLASRDHPTDDRWPQPKAIVALDPATGDELWEEREASFWSLFTGVVYMSVCYGGQDGELGECQLSARDPLTNTVRWSVPTYASAQVMGAGGFQARAAPPYLVVESFPTGHASRTITTLDPDTGRQLGARFDSLDGHAAFPDVLVSVVDDDENPADGCTATLTGYEVNSGRQAWEYIAATPKEPDGVYCRDQPDPDASSGRLAVTSGDGRPAVLDAGSGQVQWTGPKPGRGVAATEDLLLALEPSGEEGEQLVLYELSGGERRWRAAVPPGAVLDGAVIVDRTALTTWVGRGPVGYDLRTGESWSYTGRREYDPYVSFGPGWLAICLESGCRGYDVR
jgi:outer membrane protein assembly factor BamB